MQKRVFRINHGEYRPNVPGEEILDDVTLGLMEPLVVGKYRITGKKIVLRVIVSRKAYGEVKEQP